MRISTQRWAFKTSKNLGEYLKRTLNWVSSLSYRKKKKTKIKTESETEGEERHFIQINISMFWGDRKILHREIHNTLYLLPSMLLRTRCLQKCVRSALEFSLRKFLEKYQEIRIYNSYFWALSKSIFLSNFVRGKPLHDADTTRNPNNLH